jgi:nucleotide-binding universal stress UspA family protein
MVHAFEYPPPLLPFYDAATELGEDHLREVAHGALAAAVSEVARQAPQLAVTGEVIDGSPVEVLLEESSRAALLVVATRGMGPYGGLVIGSTGTALAGQASCPLVVVPDRPAREHPGGPVVVGVDGSPPSQAALGFAFEAAALRQVPLRAVHTWRATLRGLSEPAALRAREDRAEEVEHRMVLSEALAGGRAAYPDVPVIDEAVQDHPVRALLGASGSASLLVIGARGAGGFPGLPLGSVAQGVLHQAGCPVCVVRDDRSA